MPVNLRHRDFLKEIDSTQPELQFLLDLTREPAENRLPTIKAIMVAIIGD